MNKEKLLLKILRITNMSIFCRWKPPHILYSIALDPFQSNSVLISISSRINDLFIIIIHSSDDFVSRFDSVSVIASLL